MNSYTTALNTIQAIFRVGWASQKLGYPIEECPYKKGQRERFYWILGWKTSDEARPDQSVFDMLPFDGQCRNGSCSP